MKDWFVYIVECSDGSLYTGISTDLERRMAEHNNNEKPLGAKYTRTRRPVTLVYHERVESRSIASKREMEIKGLGRDEKLKLIGGGLKNLAVQRNS